MLPSAGFSHLGSGVFWPASDSAEAKIADGSDHHLVWVDVTAVSKNDMSIDGD